MKAVSGKDLCRILERKGWRFRHTRGSHHVYEHPDRGQRISVPVHGNKTLKMASNDD